jgi:UDPglucose 6-dehydrogenase
MIGTGYVGPVSGVCFAEFSHTVTSVDKDAAKIAQLHAGIMPIYEPGLEAIVTSNVAGGRLAFTADPAGAAMRICPVSMPPPRRWRG